MNQKEPNPASAKEKAEGSRENVNVDVPTDEPRRSKEFDTRPDLDGKTDSGPEPDVHGRELPPQK
jgi:hypothetical protein